MQARYRNRGLALLLACLIALGTFPAFAAETPETVKVTFSIDTRSIADDPAVLGEAPILDGTKTLEVEKGASVLDVTQQASEEFGFALDASSSGFITSIGWADNSYAFEIMGSAFGGWTFWVDGKSPALTAANVPLEQDSTVVWRYSVTGPDFSIPTYDQYFDLILLDEKDKLAQLVEQAGELDEASYTEEELETIRTLAGQGQAQIDAVEKEINDTYGGQAYGYFIDHMGDEAMGYPLKSIISEIQAMYRNLYTAIMQQVAVTGITLKESYVTNVCVGQTYQLEPAVLPENATDKRVTYAVDDESIATVDENGLLTALKEDIAIVTVTSVDNSEAVARCTFAFQPAPEPEPITLEQAISGAANWISERRGDFSGKYETDMDWDVFALYRSGNPLDVTAQANYLSSLQAYAANGGLQNTSDYARAVLALGAMGVDPRAFAGQDLVEPLYYGSLEKQGITAYVYGLLALDSGNYSIPDDAAWTREKLVAEIAKLQQPDGYFWIQEAWGIDNDLTAMAVCALAPYAQQEPAKSVVEKAMTWLSSQLSDNAGYVSWGSENSQTPAQVLTALTALGRDPMTDTAFVKEDKTLFHNICGFIQPDGGIAYSLAEPVSSNAMATQQVLYSLAALDRYRQDDAPLYRFTDVDTVCGTDWYAALAKKIEQAQAVELDGYTQTSYDVLENALAEAAKVTAESEKAVCVNAYLYLQKALDGLQVVIPAENGEVTVDETTVGAIEPVTDEQPLSITVQENVQQAYLELGQVVDSSPQIEISFDGLKIQFDEGTALTDGPTLVALPQRLDMADETMIKNLNGLLSSGSVRTIERRMVMGDDVPSEFNQFLTLTYPNLGSCRAAYAQNGEVVLIPSVSSDDAGKEKEYDVYAYRDGTDLIVKTRQTAEFLVFSLKSNAGGGSGSDDPVVHVTIDPTIVDGMDIMEKEADCRNGSTAYSVLEDVIGEANLRTTGSDDTVYVTGIRVDGTWLEEFDYGPESGWMYSVNGVFNQKSSGAVKVEDGDDVVWVYKREPGSDLEDDDNHNGNGGSSSRPSGGGSSSSGSGSGQTIQVTEPDNEGNTPQTSEDQAFADLADVSDWARDAVTEAAKRGLMEGYDNRFDPQRPLTRAEWTAVLTRLFGWEADETTVAFADVPEDAWYIESLAAACQSGIITGRSADTFAPDESITREELCVMLSRALQLEEHADLTFTDTTDISSWAADAVAQAVAAGLMQGRGETFDPHGAVTREMAAVVCLRVAEFQ